jgi:pyrroline-5-carboxylate reductase
MFRSIGFIGGGRVTRILLGGWKLGQALPQIVRVSDPGANSLEKLRRVLPGIERFAGDNAPPASCEIVFLALHPPVIPGVLGEIRSHLRPDATLVSLAPKISLAKLAELAGGARNVARVIPNAPSIVGEGFNPVAFSGNFHPEAKEDLNALLRVLGKCPEVREDSLEAYAILTGMGPTYLWFQLVELMRLAETFGLGSEEAAEATYRMVAGAAKTLHGSGLSPEDVIDLIPVKPLAEDEDAIREIYRSRLSALHRKLKG